MIGTLLLAGIALADAGTGEAGKEPTGLAKQVEAWRKPLLAGRGLEVKDTKLAFGHLELALAAGRLYPVRAGDDLAGVFFAGTGSFRYRSTDPVEELTYRNNTKQASSYEVSADGTVSDSIRSALVLLSAGTEKLVEWGEAGAGAPPEAATEALDRHLEEWSGSRLPPYSHLLPEARRELPAEQLVYAELDAGKHKVVYLLDPLRDKDEGLVVLKEWSTDIHFLKRRLYPRLLSVQPVGRSWLDPRPQPWLLTDLDVQLVNPQERDAKLVIVETIQAQRPLQLLRFELNSSYVGTVGARATPEELFYKVGAVSDAEGKPLVFSHQLDELLVELKSPLRAGESVKLRFELAGDILYRPGNSSYWRLSSGWYPRPSRWAMEAFTYHAVIKVPKPLVAFTNGETERRWEEEDLNCLEVRQTRPMQYAVILAGKYTTYTETRGDLKINVSSYALTKEGPMKQIAGLVFGFVEYLEPLLGDYPYHELNVVEINAYGFGQAPANLLYITKEAFTPMEDVLTQAYSTGINNRIAHEVAHAWWGNVGFLADFEDQWLSEATAEYYAALAMTIKSKGEFDKALRSWKRAAGEAKGKGTTYLANLAASDEDGSHRYDLLYFRGALLLHALRQELGDQAFFTVLKSLLRSFHRQPLWTKDMIGITNFVTKKDYKQWFDRYLLGGEMPK